MICTINFFKANMRQALWQGSDMRLDGGFTIHYGHNQVLKDKISSHFSERVT